MRKILSYEKDITIINDIFKSRSKLYNRELITNISKIFNEVEQNGDSAIYKYTEQFDKVKLNSIELNPEIIKNSINQISNELKDAISVADNNIVQVNDRLLKDANFTTEIRPGTIIGEKISPLNSVGLWVPAKKGSLISTALMLIGAAKSAGVQNIYIGIAPKENGDVDTATIAACKLAGAHKIFVGNGPAILAGFTIGTETMPEVDGVFGPGPGGIAASMAVSFSYGKKAVLGIGPTDSAILCDDSSQPEILAYDLINEAEHGPDCSSILVTTSIVVAQNTYQQLEKIINNFPDEFRKNNLKSVFSETGLGAIIVTDSIDKSIECVNEYAPEHVLIKVNNEIEDYVIENIENAGEILLGEYTPFTAGNYCIGITAVLPTNSYAKNVSGITSKDMVKVSTIGKLDKKALQKLIPCIQSIGKYENLPGHVLAVEKRFS